VKNNIRMIGLTLVSVIGAVGCKPMTDQTMARVNPEPASSAWWLRIEFRPTHDTIRGIPVGNLDASWARVSVLHKDVIPRRFLFEGGSDIMAACKLEFNRSGDFDHDGIEDDALVGVYESKTGTRGEFILIVTKRHGGWEKIFIESWPGKSGFLALAQHGRNLVVWDCMECDSASELAWDKGARKFYWVPATLGE
jgi:hypothetical protein